MLACQAAKGSVATPQIAIPFLDEGFATNLQMKNLKDGGDNEYLLENAKMEHRDAFSFSVNARPDIASRLTSYMLGDSTIAGAGDPYTHTITRDERQWLTLERKLNTTVQQRLVDCKFETMTIQGSAGNPVKISIEGNALEAEIRTTALTPSYDTEQPFMFYDGNGRFQIDNNVSVAIKGFEIGIKVTSGGGLKDDEFQLIDLPDFNYSIDCQLELYTSNLERYRTINYNNDVLTYATFAIDKDLLWARNGGSLTGTLNGGAAVAGGYLNCTGGTNKSVGYNNNNIIETLIQQGAIKFIVKPNYNGAPAGDRTFFWIHGSSPFKNTIWLQHKADGNIYIRMDDVLVGAIIGQNIGIWAPTSGTDYELEFNFQINEVDGSKTRLALYIDGVQLGSDITGVTGTRSNDIKNIYIGPTPSPTTADASFKDFVIYNRIQHTANYTKGYVLSATIEEPITEELATGSFEIDMQYVATTTRQLKLTVPQLTWQSISGITLNPNGSTMSETIAGIAVKQSTTDLMTITCQNSISTTIIT